MMSPDEIYKRLTNAGLDWADKLHAAELLERASKSVYSKCVLKHKTQKSCSVTEAEHHANFDPEYMDAKVAAIDARNESIKAKVVYDGAQSWFEAKRSSEATHRAAARAAPA